MDNGVDQTRWHAHMALPKQKRFLGAQDSFTGRIRGDCLVDYAVRLTSSYREYLFRDSQFHGMIQTYVESMWRTCIIKD